MKNSQIIDINEGRTNNFLVHGMGVLVLAFVMLAIGLILSSFLILFLCVLILVGAVMLFRSTNGLEIDKEKEAFRRYGKIGPYKTGKWEPLFEPKKAVLKIYSSSEYRSSAALIGMVANLDTKATTFDIQMIDALDERVSIYDFLKYSKAKEALKQIAEVYQIPVEDKIKEKLEFNRNNRR